MSLEQEYVDGEFDKLKGQFDRISLRGRIARGAGSIACIAATYANFRLGIVHPDLVPEPTVETVVLLTGAAGLAFGAATGRSLVTWLQGGPVEGVEPSEDELYLEPDDYMES